MLIVRVAWNFLGEFLQEVWVLDKLAKCKHIISVMFVWSSLVKNPCASVEVNYSCAGNDSQSEVGNEPPQFFLINEGHSVFESMWKDKDGVEHRFITSSHA